MKTVEIAVCDDEQVHIDRIVKYIEVYSEESEININITSYNSGMALLKDIENDDLNGFLPANYMSGYDNMIISVHGNEDRILLTARYDNLGKGASGAAIECMNYKLGKENTFGLIIKE